MTDTDRERLIRHLFAHVDDPEKGRRYPSGFLAAVESARKNSGRNEAGVVVNHAATGDWLGAVAWIIVIDQVGTCFQPAGFDVQVAAARTRKGLRDYVRGKGLARPLAAWVPERDMLEVLVLQALRNALAHDFSLWNLNSNDEMRHHFRLDNDPTRLMALPKVTWNMGDTLTDDNQTDVSLRQLGDLGELVVARVRQAFTDGALEVRLSGGITELQGRYGITFLY